MANNYANSAGYANAFSNLTGLLNMFLQNQINRKNIEDDRKYQDENYEKKLIDSITTNAVKALQKGEADAYGSYLGNPTDGGTRKVNIMGQEQDVPVGTPQKVMGNKMEYIDYSNILDRIKSGNVFVKPNEKAITGKSDYSVLLDDQTAKILNNVYNTKYTAGQRVPYNLLSGLSALTTNQRRQETVGVITPKEAMNQLNKWQKAFNSLGSKSDDDVLVGMVEDPIANGYLQKSGLYDAVLKKYNEVIQKRQKDVDIKSNNDGGGFFSGLFKNKKKTETETIKNNNGLRQQAIEQLQQQDYKITEDNIRRVIAILEKEQ